MLPILHQRKLNFITSATVSCWMEAQQDSGHHSKPPKGAFPPSSRKDCQLRSGDQQGLLSTGEIGGSLAEGEGPHSQSSFLQAIIRPGARKYHAPPWASPRNSLVLFNQHPQRVRILQHYFGIQAEVILTHGILSTQVPRGRKSKSNGYSALKSHQYGCLLFTLAAILFAYRLTSHPQPWINVSFLKRRLTCPCSEHQHSPCDLLAQPA